MGASAPAILSPKQILEHVESKTIMVFIPEWNAEVPCKIPDADGLFQLRMENVGKEEFEKALFKSALVGFSDADIKKLEAGNGLKYFQLFTAVMSNTDLFATAMQDGNIKK